MVRTFTLVSLCLCTVSWAQTRLPFDEAVARAGGNPRVSGGRLAAQGVHQAAARSPVLDANPVVSIAAGGRTSPANERGFEGGLSLTQSVGLEGSAGARRDALRAEAGWLDAELDAERLTRTLAVARAWLELREAEQHSVGANAELENEQHFVELVNTLVAAGELTAADRAAAEVRAIDARVRSQVAEGALVDARAQMVAELGPAAEGEYVTEGAMPEVAVPSAQAVERFESVAAELPVVRARRLLARSELLRADEERAMRGIRVNVGVEAHRDALTAVVVQGTLSSTLPVFAVGDREFAARQASARKLEGEAADEQTRARAMVAVAVHEVEHTREVLEVLATRLLPATEQTVAMRERQLVAGDATLLDVLDARRQRFEAQWRVVQATREKTWALIRLVSLMRATEVST